MRKVLLTSLFTTLMLLSLNSNAQDVNKISVYPNPVNSELFIKTTQPLSKVIIISMIGQEVVNTVLKDNQLEKEINVESLKKGIYFVRLYDQDGTLVEAQKLIKK